MPNFHLFTMLYGDAYIELFKRACLQSLLWPKNLEAIRGRTWNIFTTKDHFEQIAAIFQGLPFNCNIFEMGPSMRVTGAGYIPTAQCDNGVIMQNGLRDQISWSLQNKSKMLFAPPDTLFGEGTIGNMLALGQSPGTCVFAAHPRVLPSILSHVSDIPIKNDRLVSLTMEYAHKAWEYAEIGHPHNNSYVGGIAWKRLPTGEIAVTHRLPTPYFMDFVDQDFDFWWGVSSFGAMDHTWPGERMIRQQRVRYAGSSDACFMVEITEEQKNVPPIVQSKQTEDEFWGDKLHHTTNRLFNVIFRGEK